MAPDAPAAKPASYWGKLLSRSVYAESGAENVKRSASTEYAV